ncbi:MerR family transcriptional regulator [Streptomyces canus]|uniref:MerR family transcriptional regulator n=1 Tax=Streptomyces canus TaxID=58343 RepID=UPI00386359BF|nr:helix-turn-helix domain-containing protein [Streptomyces canus]
MRYASIPPGYLTTELAAQACGVQPATIRDWVRRGILTRAAGSTRHPLYAVDDVTAAKTAPKPNSSRARRAEVNSA